MKSSFAKIFMTLLIFSVAGMARGSAYTELLSWNTIHAGTGSNHFSHVVDGTTSYHTFSGGNSPCITKVESIGGITTSQVLVSSATWSTASGTTSIANYYGFALSGNDLMWTDTGTDSIWKVDTSTGAITQYVTPSAIKAVTGLTTVACLAPQDVVSDGELVFYEGDSDSLLKTTPAGSVTTLVSASQLVATFGNSTISGGITDLEDGTLLWGNSTNSSLCGRNGDGTSLFTALSLSDITSVTGKTGAGFGDIFAAPDGLVYFYESTADSILRFHPTSAASTLEVFLGEAELNAGPMAGDNVVTLGWYGNGLTFHTFSGSGLMLAPVPEPSTIAMTLLLVSLGGLLRRRNEGRSV